ncbi:unnamed protein product [Brassica rapa subsp. narinosa]
MIEIDGVRIDLPRSFVVVLSVNATCQVPGERYPGPTEVIQTSHVLSRVGPLSLAMPKC